MFRVRDLVGVEEGGAKVGGIETEGVVQLCVGDEGAGGVVGEGERNEVVCLECR